MLEWNGRLNTPLVSRYAYPELHTVELRLDKTRLICSTAARGKPEFRYAIFPKANRADVVRAWVFLEN